jgi:DNA helicase-2/ATP-dependent DNA helicase PcrA
MASPETTMEIDALLGGLNDPQREAVTHGEGPLLILAGAGSGKTRVLTHRIAYLTATETAKPSEILAITFTNKAAGEMRDRAELLVGRRVRAMWVMTFHAACARMMRAHADRLGYTRQFTIYDQADARRLVKRCLDELGVDPKRFTPSSIHAQISDAKNRLRDADAYGQLVGSYFEQTVADVYRIYERELHRMNAMDFDDLLLRAVNVLELFPEVRERYATGFRHVLVDEYQDTNHAQYRWLRSVATWRWSVTPISRFISFVALTYATSSSSKTTSRTPMSFGSSRTTARPRRSWTPPTRSSRTIAAACQRLCGPTWDRATRSRCASSMTSTPRHGS